MSRNSALAVAVLALILAGPRVHGAARGATTVQVEAELFERAIDLGGYPIETVDCAQASGLLAVDGIDLPGEGLVLSASFELAGCYDIYVGYQAEFDDLIGVRLTVVGAGPGQDSSIFVLPGEGIG